MEVMPLSLLQEWGAFYQILHGDGEGAKSAAPTSPKRMHWRDIKGALGTLVKPQT